MFIPVFKWYCKINKVVEFRLHTDKESPLTEQTCLSGLMRKWQSFQNVYSKPNYISHVRWKTATNCNPTTSSLMWPPEAPAHVWEWSWRRWGTLRNLISKSWISPCCVRPSQDDSVDGNTNVDASGLIRCCDFLLNIWLSQPCRR